MKIFWRAITLGIISLALSTACRNLHNSSKPSFSNGEIQQLKKKANGGDAEAAFELSEYYSFTYYNRDQAIVWLTKSAENGNAIAEYNLGMIFSGEIYPDLKDVDKAKLWFNEALNNGDLKAKEKLDSLK